MTHLHRPTSATGRRALKAAGLLLGASLLSSTTATAVAGHGPHQSGPPSSRTPSVWTLTGDAGGSKFEGIGADQRRGVFYVSEVTGGEIHRGTTRSSSTQQWLAGDGTDGRFTARGITTDLAGNVYVAGGPNGLGTGRPDLWVYSRHGHLLAALRAPGNDTFLNDVAIGPDGAAYFTDSNDARIIRVAPGRGGWSATVWVDASDTVERGAGFNWGGIVTTADRSGFVVAQGNAGLLWRVDARTGATTRVETNGADLVNADGLVRRGNSLTVVRNFSRMLATLRLSSNGHRAHLLRQVATDPDRVLTTAKELRGRVLYVDSKFDEAVASGPYEVITRPTVW